MSDLSRRKPGKRRVAKFDLPPSSSQGSPFIPPLAPMKAALLSGLKRVRTGEIGEALLVWFGEPGI